MAKMFAKGYARVLVVMCMLQVGWSIVKICLGNACTNKINKTHASFKL